MHALWLLIFTIAVGFTASGIIANLYRVCGWNTDSFTGRAVRAAVLVVAGPSVLFATAMRGRLAKTWHPISFWLAVAAIFYWSLVLGLIVLEAAVAL